MYIRTLRLASISSAKGRPAYDCANITKRLLPLPRRPNLDQNAKITRFRSWRSKQNLNLFSLFNCGSREADPKTYRVHVPPASTRSAIRTKLKMSQTAFAARFGILPSTLPDWEQNRRHPDGGARVPLIVIDKEPDAVIDMKDGRWPSVTARCATSSESRSATDRTTRRGLQNEADSTRKTMLSRHQRHRSSRLATGRSTR
jgi:putative transcriptional regulator